MENVNGDIFLPNTIDTDQNKINPVVTGFMEY